MSIQRHILLSFGLLALAACQATTDPVRPASLTGRWQLTSLHGQAVAVNVQNPNHLSFGALPEQFNAYAGCNQLSGRYQHQGDAIAFGDLATTRMLCPAAVMGLEQNFSQALAKARFYKIDNQMLVLLDEQQKAVAEFKSMPLYRP